MLIILVKHFSINITISFVTKRYYISLRNFWNLTGPGKFFCQLRQMITKYTQIFSIFLTPNFSSIFTGVFVFIRHFQGVFWNVTRASKFSFHIFTFHTTIILYRVLPENILLKGIIFEKKMENTEIENFIDIKPGSLNEFQLILHFKHP